MTLDNKIALLTLIKNKDSCNGVPCEMCHPHIENYHRSFSNTDLDNDERYALLYKEAIRFAVQEGLLTEAEAFEELL